jgi:hypothetical protein
MLRQGCGFDDLHAYRVDVIILESGAVACQRPGDAIATVSEDCRLPLTLDQYELHVIEPEFSELLCSIVIEHDWEPTKAEIRDACGSNIFKRFKAGSATLKYVGSKPKPDPTPPAVCAPAPLGAGFGIYDQAPDVQSLWTNTQLSWLAGRLIWFGFVRPQCEGGRSGLDPNTLAADGCGMAAAQNVIVDWQNQFNGDIYGAAVAYQVPARLIKRMIAVESQYWPAWSNDHGEFGMLQVSQSGADVLLRYDPRLDPDYPKRPTDQQYWKRLDVLRVLACAGCSVVQAIDHTHAVIPIYARLLAAYRCRAVEINPALAGASAWQQAASDFNGNSDYLRKVEQ